MPDYAMELLKAVGIKKGQTVLDFGCGEGNYTIPAAKLVKNEGKVYLRLFSILKGQIKANYI